MSSLVPSHLLAFDHTRPDHPYCTDKKTFESQSAAFITTAILTCVTCHTSYIIKEKEGWMNSWHLKYWYNNANGHCNILKDLILDCSISMVFLPVTGQMAWGSTDIFTVVAFVRFFSSVPSIVNFQCGCPRGQEITVVTFVCFFSTVYSFVVFQCICLWKR